MSSAADALEKLVRLERDLEKKCHDLGYYTMIHVGLREFVEHAAAFRAALVPPHAGEVEECARQLEGTMRHLREAYGSRLGADADWIERAARLLRATQSNGHSPDAGSASAGQRVAEAGSCALTSAIEPATSVKDTEAATSGESPAPSAPAQEPVAWYHNDNGSLELSRIRRVGWKPLYAAPQLDEAVALLREVVRRYDDYRGKGMLPAPGEYQMVVGAIERIRAFLKDRI